MEEICPRVLSRWWARARTRPEAIFTPLVFIGRTLQIFVHERNGAHAPRRNARGRLPAEEDSGVAKASRSLVRRLEPNRALRMHSHENEREWRGDKEREARQRKGGGMEGAGVERGKCSCESDRKRWLLTGVWDLCASGVRIVRRNESGCENGL
eukprot:2925956-Pleurochrysis_carterae.AAC.1